MRILVYPHDLNMGGSQTNAIELAAAVTRLGHECIVFGRPGSLCSRISELGLEFVEAPEPRRRPSPAVARAIRALVAERGIDVVHGYEWPPGLEVALAAETLPQTAAVCTVMSMAVAPFLPRWLPLVVGTQQISAAEQVAGRLDVHLVEPPVDLEHNRALPEQVVAGFRRAWDLDDRLPTVVIVSRLVPDLKAEGIFSAIQAVVDLDATAPFQLLVVGDGRARASMEEAGARADELTGRRAVVFTGELSDPRPAYAAADVVVGMGGSALRSLAFAKPLVVQGEGGYFRTLTEDTVDEFRWAGWYGDAGAPEHGPAVLAAQLTPLLTDAARRRRLGAFGRSVVEDFSLERAALQQVSVYRDAVAARARQKRRFVEAGRTVAGLASYHVRQRADRWRGRQRSDDFNARPVAGLRPGAERTDDRGTGPVLWFPGVGWDTLAGTDKQLVRAIADRCDVVWVDTPHSVLRARDRGIPAVSRPVPGVVRLRAPVLAGVQRPLLRRLASRQRVAVARRYLRSQGLRPRAVVAATPAPVLPLAKDLGGLQVYYATDDFVPAGALWGVSKRYLGAAREQNLAAADLVLAVTPALGRHLQRGPRASLWLPNGADLAASSPGRTEPVRLPLAGPVAGVVGQFNARTDLALLDAVQRDGTSLLLVGPRSYVDEADEAAFDELVARPGVHWVGPVDREQLPAHLAALDVGLTPYADSLFNRRSYPLKTLEYLAHGVPVVSSDVPPLTGLDDRWVSAAATPEEFARLVRAVAHRPRDVDAVRRSVEGQGWYDRGTRLLAWLAPHDDGQDAGRALEPAGTPTSRPSSPRDGSEHHV